MHSCRSFQSRWDLVPLLLFWGRRQWRSGGSKDLPRGQRWSLNLSLHVHSLATLGMPCVTSLPALQGRWMGASFASCKTRHVDFG